MFRKSALVLTAAFLFALFTNVNAQSGRVAATPTPTPVDETIRVETEEIKLNVLAFDEDGKFFPGVTTNDLVITENNVLHQPTSVRRMPASVLIVLDTGGEMRYVKSLERTRNAALELVRSLAADDQIAIMQYADKAEMLSEWTTDRQESIAAIKRSNFGRRSAFVDALNLARDFFLRSAADNRHLVLITDGTDSLGRASAKFDAMRDMRTTDVTVHVVSYNAMEAADIEPRTRGISKTPPRPVLPPEVVDQLPNGTRDAAKAPRIVTINTDRTFIKKMKDRKADLDRSREMLESLAADTNGQFLLPDSPEEMIDKIPLIARMIGSSYVVTYMPKVPVAETRGIAERRIEVTSRRPGLIVESRKNLLIKSGSN